MNKDIEIVSNKYKVYIPDLTNFHFVKLLIASNKSFDTTHTLKLYDFDGDYVFFDFDFDELNICLEYYEKIKNILKNNLNNEKSI